MRTRLESYFRFAEHQTTWRIEVLAGLTTFITMAYIIFVNPAILSQTGMPLAAVTTSTCLCAAFGSILMGALANYPLALAPGMGLNAYFTYTVVKGMGVPWQTALGAVFLSGVIFLLLTFGGIRQRLVAAIPYQLHAAVAGGIGLFIAFIGLINSGLIIRSNATTVTLGDLHQHTAQLAIFGILLDRHPAGLQGEGLHAHRRARHARRRHPLPPGQVHAQHLQPHGHPRDGLPPRPARRAAR